MPSWIVPSDTHVISDTGHTTDHNHVADDLTLVNTLIPAVSGGLTGATGTFRIVGAIASGTAPASGTFVAGDVIIVLTGGIILCTVGGSVGTWVNIAGGGFAGGTLTQYLAPAVVTLTYATTVTVNAAAGNDFRLTLTASTATMGAPSSPVDGQRIDFMLTQGTGGSFTVAWNAVYDFGTAGAPTLSTAAGKIDIIGFVYNAAATKWLCMGAALGF